MNRIRRHHFRLVTAALVLATSPCTLAGQSPPCAPPTPLRAWVRLCPDGNGLPMLRRRVELRAARTSVAEALREIARLGATNITLDASLPALRQSVNLAAGQRTVAEALLQVVHARAMEIDVGIGGELIVIGAAPPETTRAATASDSIPRAAVLAPLVVSATRVGAPIGGGLSTVTYREHDLSLAPGFFGTDPLRAARLLPGLSARNDVGTSLNARGGESDQTLVMLDGMPLYYPFHVGGLVSTFIDPAVGALDLFTGVFPARYNGRLSALLDVHSAEEARQGAHGIVDVNLLASTASVGGTTHDASTSWLLAGRRTYADAIAKLAQQRLPYHFEDVDLHVLRRLRGGSELRLTAYGGGDVADYTESDDSLDVSAMNAGVGLTWSTVVRREVGLRVLHADSVALMQRASLSAFDANARWNSDDEELRTHVRDARTSGSLTAFVGRTTHAIGYELDRQRTGYDVALPFEALRNLAPTGHAIGVAESASGWYEAAWSVSPALLVQAGGRIDLVRQVGALVSPRLSTKLQLSPDLALTAAVGRHEQWLHSVLREEVPVRLLDFWIPSDSLVPPASAWVYSVGLQRSLGSNRRLVVEAYHKQLGGLAVRNALEDPMRRGDEIIPERGRSSGVDVLLRQIEKNGFSGWLAYSFGVSRRVDGDGISYAPPQDRRHELTAVASWRSQHYRLGARFSFASGNPYSLVAGQYTRDRYDPVRDEWGPDVENHASQYLSAPRQARFPVSHRLDLSLTREDASGRSRTFPYISIANVYGAFNPMLYVFRYDVSSPERLGTSNFRFMPTFGVRHVF